MILEKWFYLGRSKKKLREQAQRGSADGSAPAPGGEAELARLRKENKMLRNVVMFYANAKNWEAGYKHRDPDDATIFVDSDESGVSVDKGERARQAMATLAKQQQKQE